MFSMYEIREDGQVFSKRSNRFLKPWKDPDGYLRLCLTTDDGKKKGMAVHRLVAMTYLPEYSDDLTVDHINCDKEDNSVGNLQMLTASENISKSHRDGIHEVCAIGRSKKIYAFKDGIGALFPSISQAAKILGLDPRNISQILNGRGRYCHGYTFKFVK